MSDRIRRNAALAALSGLLVVLPTGCGGPASGSPRPAIGVATSQAADPRLGEETPVRYAFPVGTAATFGRYHHDYPATDVFAPCGTPVLAPTSGTFAEVSTRDAWQPQRNAGATRGGLSFSIVGDDGVRYYGSHLGRLYSGARPGRRVAAGRPIGQVGHTGDARGIACHLHFGISPPCATGDWWVRRGVVSPYAFLTAWRHGVQTSPAAAVAAWRRTNGCPKSLSALPSGDE